MKSAAHLPRPRPVPVAPGLALAFASLLGLAPAAAQPTEPPAAQAPSQAEPAAPADPAAAAQPRLEASPDPTLVETPSGRRYPEVPSGAVFFTHQAVPLTPEAPPTELRQARSRRWRERRHKLHGTLGGAVGGFRVVDAGSGAPGAFRFALSTSLVTADGWPEPGGEDYFQNLGHMILSWTLNDTLEVYGVMESWAIDAEDDAVIRHTHTTAGLKGFRAVLPWLTAGGDLSFRLPLNTTREAGAQWEATSLALRANLAADLGELNRKGLPPLIARLNLSYTFDNSAAVVKDQERARYAELPTEGPDARRPLSQESRHLLGAAAQYAARFDRVDRLTVALGLELPWEFTQWNTTVSPIMEWLLHVPVNRQGFSCPRGGVLGCMDDADASAVRQSLILGARVLPRFRGLNLFTAMEFALAGADARRAVHELSLQPGFTFMAGFGYAHDPGRSGED